MKREKRNIRKILREEDQEERERRGSGKEREKKIRKNLREEDHKGRERIKIVRT